MEQPVLNQGAPASKPETPALPPHLLSRDYEDYLDWLENQRRSHTRGGGIRRLFGTFSVVAAAFSLAGVVFRRR